MSASHEKVRPIERDDGLMHRIADSGGTVVSSEKTALASSGPSVREGLKRPSARRGASETAAQGSGMSVTEVRDMDIRVLAPGRLCFVVASVGTTMCIACDHAG